MSIQAPIRQEPLYEPGEAAPLTSLLAEYTKKLRADCDRFDGAIQRRNTFRAILVIFAVIFVAVITYAVGDAFKPPSIKVAPGIALTIRVMTLTFIGAGAVWLVRDMINTWSFVNNSLRRSRSQIEASAKQLERLVRRTSPISEHSKLSLTEKLGLDLRLADADAALEYAEQYTGKQDRAERIAAREGVYK